MKLALPIELINKKDSTKVAEIKTDYDAPLLSLVKYGLSKTNPELFHELYDTNAMKHFATSVYFSSARFNHDKITLSRENKLVLYFSTSNLKLATAFYNAFAYLHLQSQKARKHLAKPIMFDNKYIADVWKPYRVKDQKITKSEQLFKTVSPIIVENNNKRFLSCTDQSNLDEYNRALCCAINAKVKSNSELAGLVDSFKFEPISTKKTVKREFNMFVEATVGIFKLTGDPKLLNYLQENGLGIKTGTFNGMIVAI